MANPVAELMAEAGIAIFKNAFERWVADKSERDLAQPRMTLDDLKAVAASTNTPSRLCTGTRGGVSRPAVLDPPIPVVGPLRLRRWGLLTVRTPPGGFIAMATRADGNRLPQPGVVEIMRAKFDTRAISG